MRNIGILFPLAEGGGVFQYALSVAQGLLEYCDEFNYFIIYHGSESPERFLKKGQFIALDSKPNNIIGKIKFLSNILLGKPLFSANKKNKELIEGLNLDLLIVPFPLVIDYKVPYLTSVLDIMHKYYPEFPEYKFLERLKRDLVYKYSARHSVLNIVDSQQGLDDLHKYYKIKKEKIRIVPYIPPGYIFKNKNVDTAVLNKYNLPEKFLFYPAQFWYHKNHLRLVKALKMIKKEIPLVLVGNPKANKKNYKKVMELGRGFVKHLGYVPEKEIVALYRRAYALIFPSLIGPTSIPPLEAMVLGTPVLCSNLFSMPEQIGDAGILFNPFSINDMAEKISLLWGNEELKNKLIVRGYERSKNINLENFAKKWELIIKQAINGKH